MLLHNFVGDWSELEVTNTLDFRQLQVLTTAGPPHNLSTTPGPANH
jgi:hypothetical protein